VALLDGEGSFAANGKYTNIVVNMTDEDTVRLAHQRAGCGHVTGPHQPKEKRHKPFWIWKVSRRQHVFALCKAVLPYMSERRRQTIEAVLAKEKRTAIEPIWIRLASVDR
jgi:hypothetical protein